MNKLLDTHIHIRSNKKFDALAAELAKRAGKDTSETIRQAIAFAHDSGAMFEIWLTLNRETQDEQTD